jgi:hypothetical protein
MDFSAEAPDVWHSIPPEEREARCELTSDLCIIDKQVFFVRGCLEIPVTKGEQPFVWGVWVSLSEANFQRTLDLWEVQGREAESPYFGWLMTALPGYPQTRNLKTMVHTRPVGESPWVELEPTEHPLAVQQRQGITMAEVQRIVETLLHPQNS